MNLIKSEITFKINFDENNCEGISNPSRYITDGIVTRIQTNDYIVWYGICRNFKYNNGQWFKLDVNDWSECEIPQYEIEFRKI